VGVTEEKANSIDIMHILIAYRLLTPPTSKSVNRGHNVEKPFGKAYQGQTLQLIAKLQIQKESRNKDSQ
jgi:hypothetical protein